ncbi:MAG: DnaA/Hda family protein, partial [Armatimonadota bacterium]
FIWGGPGLGKTHLLQAIGHYVTENFPHKKVIFVTSEQFTDDFVNSLRAKRVDGFKQKYRSADVLLIDDIQFLESKEGIQEQFFNTFNELQRRGKAIVLASDRPPKDINMEERYQSRFAMGLPADIQPPNFETRLAILKQFAEFEQDGTLPNMIHGDDARNRDTSDAPLWFIVACADVCRAVGHPDSPGGREESGSGGRPDLKYGPGR